MFRVIERLAAAAGLLVALSSGADAACQNWYTLTNNTTADASQVMSNFNYIIQCPDFTGNVGIGTTSPQSNLHIDGNNANAIGLFVENDSAGLVTYAQYPITSLIQAGASGYGIPGWANAGVLEADTTGGLILDAYGPNGGPIQLQTNRATRVSITNSGNVGIGTMSPATPLDVNVGSSPHLYVGAYGCGTTYAGLGFSNGGSSCTSYSVLGDGTNTFLNAPSGAIYVGIGNVYKMTVTSGGVGFGTNSPTYPLYVNGSGYATGTFINGSDRRLKKNIEPLKVDALGILSKIQPVSFRWRKPQDDGMQGAQLGFIAQDVEKVLPSVVLTQHNAERTKGLKYNEFIPLLTKAVQELRAENDDLRKANAWQADANARLHAELDSVLRRLSTVEAKLANEQSNLHQASLVTRQ